MKAIRRALMQTRVAAFGAGLLVAASGVGLLFDGFDSMGAAAVFALGAGTMASAFVMPPGLW